MKGRGPADTCFVADAMLGRLARWLRLLGYDTAYDARLDDAELVRVAREQGRILLTRDRTLFEERRPESALVIASDAPLDQLMQVVRDLGLEASEATFTRCTVCNGQLAPVDRESVRSEVPEQVLREHRRFLRCPDCRRVYWPGSHSRRMRATLRATLGGLGPGS